MIAKLTAALNLDGKNFTAGVKGAKTQVTSFEKQLGGLKRTMAGAFSVAAISIATKRLIDFASEIRHTADNLNVTTDFLQAVNARALTYGVTVENVSQAMAKMAIAQGRVLEGDKLMVDAFDALGISQEKIADMGTEELLLEIGKSFSEATNQVEAMNAVADILGVRVGPKLFAMLKDIGGEGMDSLIDGAKKAGDVIDEEMITKLELLGTRLDQIKMRSAVFAADTVGSFSRGMKMTSEYWATILSGGSNEEATKNMMDLKSQLKGQTQAQIDQKLAERQMIKDAQKAALNQETENVKQSAEAQADAHVKAWITQLAKLDAEKEKMAQKDAARELKIANDLADIKAGKGTSLGSVDADSLARIGGRIGRDVDPQLRVLDRQLQIQQNIENYVRDMANNTGLA
ncbi:hypothetical protein N9204_00390 [bacterium]|nr:hypothetical protein [bacterium]